MLEFKDLLHIEFLLMLNPTPELEEAVKEVRIQAEKLFTHLEIKVGADHLSLLKWQNDLIAIRKDLVIAVTHCLQINKN